MNDYIFSYFIFAYSKFTSLFINKSFNIDEKLPQSLRNFSLQYVIKPQTHSDESKVSVYKNKNGENVIVKSLSFPLKNSAYFRLIKEAKLLEKLQSRDKHSILKFPKILSFSESPQKIALVQEFINGKELASYNNTTKKSILFSCIHSLANLSKHKNIDSISKIIGKRSKLYILMTFPIFSGIVLIRDVKHIKFYLTLIKKFYHYYIAENIFDPNYVIAHRDIHTKNIIIKNKNYFLLDTEVMTIAEKHTDVAIMAKAICRELDDEYIPLLKDLLYTNSDKKSFLALSVYYAFQIMAIRQKSDSDYTEAYLYLHKYFNKSIKLLELKHETIAQIVIRFLLNFIYFFLRIDSKKIKIADNIILCYHNVGVDSWNFTISPQSLIEQLSWLKSNYSLVRLEKVITSNSKKKKPQIAITFDDGYTNMLSVVAPIMKTFDITPTLFILGNSKKANRKELDNSIPLLSDDEIRQLQIAKWDFGYHTATHPNLRKLSPKQLQYEIVECKNETENKFGITLPYFAYPRGIYTEQTDNYVKKAGYTAAFTVDGGAVKKSTNSNHINRICFEGDLSLSQFKALLSPPGITMYAFSMKALQVKEKYSQLMQSLIKFNPISHSNLLAQARKI